MTTLDVDLLHPSAQQEALACKKKTFIPNPRSQFVDLRCAACMEVTTAFSHSDVNIACCGCNAPLAYATGGKIHLVEEVEMRPRANV